MKIEIPQTIKWVEQTSTPTWNPIKEKDQLVGKIIEVKSTSYGNIYKVVGDWVEDGKKKSGEVYTPLHKLLLEFLLKADVGLYVKIIYQGEKDSKFTKKTQLYSVLLGYPQAEISIHEV